MKVNGLGRWKLEQGGNSWQWAKHAWLYSDLLQALIKGEHVFLNDQKSCALRMWEGLLD